MAVRLGLGPAAEKAGVGYFRGSKYCSLRSQHNRPPAFGWVLVQLQELQTQERAEKNYGRKAGL